MTPSALVEPAYRSSPPFTRTLGPEVADLATLVDFEPDPEQRLGLDMLFALDARSPVGGVEFAVVCSRQNLKTGLFQGTDEDRWPWSVGRQGGAGRGVRVAAGAHGCADADAERPS